KRWEYIMGPAPVAGGAECWRIKMEELHIWVCTGLMRTENSVTMRAGIIMNRIRRESGQYCIWMRRLTVYILMRERSAPTGRQMKIMPRWEIRQAAAVILEPVTSTTPMLEIVLKTQV